MLFIPKEIKDIGGSKLSERKKAGGEGNWAEYMQTPS